MNNAQAIPQQPIESGIGGSVQNVESAIGRTEDLISQLTQRLASVLLESPPNPPSGGSSGTKGSLSAVPVASAHRSRIDLAFERLAQRNYELQFLLERLDL